MTCLLRQICWRNRPPPEVHDDDEAEDPPSPLEPNRPEAVFARPTVACSVCRYLVHSSGICARCIQKRVDPLALTIAVSSPSLRELDIGKVLRLTLQWDVANSIELAQIDEHITIVAQDTIPHVMSFGVACLGIDETGSPTGVEYHIVFDLMHITGHTKQPVTVLRNGSGVAQLLAWTNYTFPTEPASRTTGGPTADAVQFNI
jgi:hypothetical protein